MLLIPRKELAFVGLSLLCFSCNNSLSLDPSDDPGTDDTGIVREELCDDGLDNDLDGQVDEGCSCMPGTVQACYTGSARTRGKSPCADGEQKCEGEGSDGTWGPCEGSVGPAPEDLCDDGIDQDCNGEIDDGPWCSGQGGGTADTACTGSYAALCSGSGTLDIDLPADPYDSGGSTDSGGAGDSGEGAGSDSGNDGTDSADGSGDGDSVSGGTGDTSGDGILCDGCLAELANQVEAFTIGPMSLPDQSVEFQSCPGSTSTANITQLKATATLDDLEATSGDPWLVLDATLSATVDARLDANKVACLLSANCPIKISVTQVPAQIRMQVTQSETEISVDETSADVYLTQDRIRLDLSACGALGSVTDAVYGLVAPTLLTILRESLEQKVEEQLNQLSFGLPTF